MQFTQIEFAIFLAVVFSIYWLVLRNNTRAQNGLLLIASYTFYGWWDWRFLGLIMLTTGTTFATALLAKGRHGRGWTTANITLNVGVLITFKYLGFFTENLKALLSLCNLEVNWFFIEILLPVGISFYTFQAISYSVDVYKKKIEATHDFLAFATFIAYFPQLVAGPIERASQLLSQISGPRRWDRAYATSGLRMILYGVMKKVCVADMLALYADRLYSGDLTNPWCNVAAGIVFSLQIYCDFSAYSEIARGVSRLLGIELMVNFRFPYFSRNVLEFWRRWHISLMLWFRDYIYIPLGGNRRGVWRTAFNTTAVFLLSGLWHGAAWNFVAWGAYWALVYIVCKFMLKMRNDVSDIETRQLPKLVVTFMTVAFGFYIFRCTSGADITTGVTNIWAYAVVAAAGWLLSKMALAIIRKPLICYAALAFVLICVGLFFRTIDFPWAVLLKAWWLLPAMTVAVVEWKGRNGAYPLATMSNSRLRRFGFYWMCLVFVMLSEPTDMSFIYFKF